MTMDFNRGPLRGFRAGSAARLHGFRREERGSLVLLGLYFFLIMLLVAGLAVDLARFEHRRTAMQNTLDRAILAAADIGQVLEPEDVVADYFARAGLGDVAVDVAVDEGLNFRTVSARTSVEVPTLFARMMGVEAFAGPALGTAEERIGNVEISLVLDVSGSMGWTAAGTSQTKIALLRGAATDFVDTMFDTVQGPGVPAGKLSVNIVPYNQQAVIGPDLAAHFTLSSEHGASACADFAPADYARSAITPSEPLPRTAHADARYSSTAPQFVECQDSAAARIMAWEGSQSALTTRIGQLTAGGDTAIDIGLKWGVALLDPALRPVVANRIEQGKVAAVLTGRPFDHADTEAMKVVVVMTDGENTNTYAIRDPYRSGPSPLVRGDSGQDYYHWPERSGDRDFYRTSDNTWHRLSQIGGDYSVYSWPEVWAKHTVRWFDNRYVREIFGSGNGIYDSAVRHTSYGAKDDQLLAACTVAKAQGIVIFAIGFEAPPAGQAVMRACASADAYYYDAAGLSISEAFAGIASAINALRLTQ